MNPDRTLTVSNRGRIAYARPSADWLFDSIAAAYGDTAIAVVLSGYQRDGARGIVSVRRARGSVIVQDPDSADASDMPNAAIRTGATSWILPPHMIGAAITDRLQMLDVSRMEREFDNPFAA